MSAVGIAAAMERTVCSGPTAGAMSPSSTSMSCGFTAMTTSEAPATASALDSVALDAVPLPQLLDALRAAAACGDLVRRSRVGGQQAADQRLADLAGAQDGDAAPVDGHGGSLRSYAAAKR